MQFEGNKIIQFEINFQRVKSLHVGIINISSTTIGWDSHQKEY